jgi:Tfp pilus assembly protein PilZ
MSEHEIVIKEAFSDRKLPCQVSFAVGETVFRGTSMHFSEKGILVMCKHPAPLSARGKVVLGLPGSNNPVELNGEVVWTNIHGVGDSLSPKGMGIRFINVDKEVEQALAEFSAQYESSGSIYACYYS